MHDIIALGKAKRAGRRVWMRVLKMWKQIVAPTIVVILLWFAGSTITSYFIQQVTRSHVGAITENVATIRATWAMQDALWRLQATLVEAAGKSPRETLIDVAELQALFESRLQEAEESCYTEEERTLIKAVRRALSGVPRPHRAAGGVAGDLAGRPAGRKREGHAAGSRRGGAVWPVAGTERRLVGKRHGAQQLD